MLTLPTLRRLEVHERGRNLLLRASALCAHIADTITHDTVAHHDLVAAVLQNQSSTMRLSRRGRRRRKALLGLLCSNDKPASYWKNKDKGSSSPKVRELYPPLVRLIHKAFFHSVEPEIEAIR